MGTCFPARREATNDGREQSEEEFKVKRIEEWLIAQEDAPLIENDAPLVNDMDMNNTNDQQLKESMKRVEEQLQFEAEPDTALSEGTQALENVTSHGDGEMSSSLCNVTWSYYSANGDGTDFEEENAETASARV